jgi:hypothetical protein
VKRAPGYVYVPGKNLRALKTTTESLLGSKDTDVEVNTKTIQYMFISHEWNAGQNHNFKIADKGENLVKFKYLGMTLAYENCLHEEIKRKLRKCLLSFGPESFILWFSVKEYKD